jgi:microcystin-dependent protein
MSTIFPGSASVGQIFEGYEFNGTTWDIIGIDLTADYLETSAASDIYLNKVSASTTYVTQTSASTTYATKAYADNSSSVAAAALVDAAPSTLNTLNKLAAALGDDANFATTITNALSPIGSVTAYALATPPAGWLLCDGSIYSASAYPTLSVGLGSTYGGNGTTTFAVPNLKGRVPVGLDSTQTEFDTRGETGGAKTHTLTTAEMPSHQHTFSRANEGPFAGIIGSNGHGGTIQETLSTSATGGDGAHNNLQPYLVMNYIIRAT